MDLISRIKDQIILSNYCKQHIKLINKGKYFWGCCPFHQEKTPSFMIDDSKSIFHCFGCGLHGDIFSFIQKLLNIDFKGSLELLAKQLNIKISTKIENKQYTNRKKLMKEVCEYYHQTNSKIISDYLIQRNIDPIVIENFKLGYSNNTIIQYLLDNNYSKQEIESSGIKVFGMNDRFRNRLIIPIINRQQEVIGFSGRVLDKSLPKYLNSPENPIFHKGFHLYNEHQLEYKPIILVEGYMDVISLFNHNYNAAAIMGTSLTIEQIITAWKFTNTIYVAFDSDQAGEKAIHRSIPTILRTLKPNRSVMICQTIEDPDHMIKKIGPQSIDNMLKNSVNVHKYIEENILPEADNPVDYAKRLEKIEEYSSYITNPHIKKSYTYFWKYGNKKNKYMKKNNHKIPAIINTEEKLLSIILNNLDGVSLYIEKMLTKKLQNKTYNHIYQIILNNLIKNKPHNQTIQEISSLYPAEYNKLIDNSKILCKNNIIMLRFYLKYLINTLGHYRNNNEY